MAQSLLANGDFETPSLASSGNLAEIGPTSQPAGFAWSVASGTVEEIRQGYTSGALSFDAPAYDGSQWLDLDGVNPGTIFQTFATQPGDTYALSFEYANNPYIHFAGTPSASVSVVDTSTSDVLVTSLTISHGSATSANYDWTGSAPVPFKAAGPSTTLSFKSLDPQNSDSGIFLDHVSVIPIGPGDVNYDGIVNGQDISLAASHWLQTGSPVPGDANGDGIVNGQDIALMASNWLQGVNGSGGGGSSAVPEPSSIARIGHRTRHAPSSKKVSNVFCLPGGVT